MKRSSYYQNLLVLCLGCLVLLALPLQSRVKRMQIEFYGGISITSPGDLNLLSRAEEQYNDIFFYRYLMGLQGYFINDFPEITYALPLGMRIKYWVSPALAFSMGLEGYSRQQQESPTGTFTNSYWELDYTKEYDPYRLRLSCFSLLGGIHYLIPIGSHTGLEVGISAGWAKADFSFVSTWTYDVVFNQPLDINTSYHDGGTLEGDGQGDGLVARGSLRLNRSLSRNFGFFIEGAYAYCRLKDFRGSGREIRLGIPGEKTWTGTWGIKQEDLRTSWYNLTVQVPTNYWEAWLETQREREFILDLSGLQLAAGIYLRF